MGTPLELSAGRIVARASPRIVTGAIVAGTVTVDCASASAVIVNLALTANVASVVYQNLPTVCLVRWMITQSGGPWTFPANAHPSGTVVDGDYHIYSDATLTRLWWETFDGGTTATLESNAPVDATIIRQSDVDDTPVNGATTAPVSSNWAYDHAALATAHGISAAAATVLDDATVEDMVNTIGGATSTGTGGLVRATSPTLTTPVLGTPTSGTLTNCTGLPVSGIAASTATALGVGTIELGHASDTTIARVSAGVASIEGVNIVTVSATQTLTNKTLTAPTLTTPALGTPASGTLTNCGGLPVSGVAASTSAAIGVGSIELGHASDTTLARSAAGVMTVEGVVVTRTIASGTAALGTSAIASGASASVVTVAATGVATTDVIDWGFNGTPNGVTGYNAASTTGCLVITAYPTANNVNFLVSNPTAGSITPGSLTLNWSVRR